MLTKWGLTNFKSIYEADIDLAPLTVLTGTNSSGKSSLIQSMLMVAQTLSSKVSSRSVVLNGFLTRLGQFSDIKANGSETDMIIIRCTYHPLNIVKNEFSGNPYFADGSINKIACDFSFNAEPARHGSDLSDKKLTALFQVQPHLVKSKLSWKFTDENGIDFDDNISVSQFSENENPLMSSNEDEYEAEISDNLLREITTKVRSIKKIGCVPCHFLPGKLFCTYDNFEEQAFLIAEALKGNTQENEMFPKEDVAYTKSKAFELSAIGLGLGTIAFGMVPIIGPLWTTAVAITAAGGIGLSKTLGKTRSESNLNGMSKSKLKTIKTINKAIEDAISIPDRIIELLQDIVKDVIEKNTDDYNDVFNNREQGQEYTIGLWRERIDELEPKKKEAVYDAIKQCENLKGRIYSVFEETENNKYVKIEQTPRMIEKAAQYLDDYFTNSFKYLGPLRESPKALYPIAPSADTVDVGLRGENTASVLDIYKDKKIEYIPSEGFKDMNLSTIEISLEKAVTDWLQYLGIAETVETQDKGKLGHELQVKLSVADEAHDLTHVGVGVSQVLPIVVMCLLAEKGSTLVFEQPELHLHPAVQSRLADFFLSMSLFGKQCIIETHSEYFIKKLRLLIAKAPFGDNSVRDAIKIYFSTKDSLQTTFREVKVSEYGATEDWPTGFFDESLIVSEEILNATRKKLKEADKNDSLWGSNPYDGYEESDD
ncbi:DUF3696 domain-containing protein [Treponema primitia]|uniref:DUF3696 domain-containing protein n=1 Tax=Treponema primitia TaxID=88058 RepID=UPI0002554E4A|nr:DUF3696 domain-containing protein [Treponema primitia]